MRLRRARWGQYDALLARATAEGYALRGVEQWLLGLDPGGAVPPQPTLLVRHDVDEHAASAVRMARIDARHGVRGTWYFRWSTADPVAIARVRALGGDVGLHFETLSRTARERGLTRIADDDALVERAREQLRAEIAAFAARFGPSRSVCPHGDTRVPLVPNHLLTRGRELREFGVEADGNELLPTLSRRPTRVTDRGDGSWSHDRDPVTLLASGTPLILLTTHPHHWAGTASRAVARVARATGRGRIHDLPEAQTPLRAM